MRYDELREPHLKELKRKRKEQYLKEYSEKNKDKIEEMKKQHGWAPSSPKK